MYEPITVQIDRGYGVGNYRSHSLYFVGRLIRIVEDGHTTMRLYEWADPGRLPDAPSIRSSTPTPPVAPPGKDTPQRRFLGLTRNSASGSFWDFPKTRPNEVGDTPELGSDFEKAPSVPTKDRYV